MNEPFGAIEKCLREGIDEAWRDPSWNLEGTQSLAAALVELANARKLLGSLSEVEYLFAHGVGVMASRQSDPANADRNLAEAKRIMHGISEAIAACRAEMGKNQNA